MHFKIATLTIIFLAVNVLGCDNDTQTKDPLPKSSESKSLSENTPAEPSSEVSPVAPPPTSQTLSLENLAGNWVVVTIEAMGEPRPPQNGMPESIEIVGDVFSVYSGEKTLETFSNMKMILNLSKDPAELDLVRTNKGQAESLPCILRLVDGNLDIGMPLVPAKPEPGERLQRPTSFDTKSGPIMVLSAKRSE